MTNQPFNPEEWLNSKKKGISGKVPRADFIAKMKELAGEIENLKQEKSQLATKNKEAEEKLSTSQTELVNRDQIIKDKNNEIESLKNKSEKENNEYQENISNLQTKTEEQNKTIEDLQNEIKIKEETLKDLQSRPDITEQKYQELLNNQEKHKQEDLKPENFPTDWEKQLAEKKELEKNFSDLKTEFEKKLSLSEEKFSQLETKLTEIEQRPTIEDLNKAVQQEADKYKDYNSIKESYSEIKKKYEGLLSKEGNLPSSLPINEEGIIKGVAKLLTDTLNPLRLEITEIKKQLVNNPLPENSSSNSPSELPTDYEELKVSKQKLLRVLGILGSKIN